MKFKSSRWMMVVVGAIAFWVLATMVWASPPVSPPSDPPGPPPFDERYVNDNAGEVDDADVGDGALSPSKIAGVAWTADNDGPGTGLHADVLDGQEGAYYLDWNNLCDVPSGFADGLDHDTTYTPGNQLDLVGTTFNVVESGLDADLLDGEHGSFYRSASNINAGTLDTLYYSAHSDLTAEGYLGNDSGDLAQNNGVLQSNLDADLLDGQHGSYYLDWGNLTSVPGGFADGVDDDTTYSAGDGLTLADSTFSVNFAGSGGATTVARSDHTHDDRYYTESESESRYVNVTGDTMSGALTVPQVTYTTPRTHYFVVGSEGFVPESNVNYSNGGGCGGAYRTTTGALVAPVHLPHGAVVTEFKVFFYDTSSGDMLVRLSGHHLSSCGFFTLADVYSSGTSGYYSVTDTALATINNMAYSYHVRAYSTEWDGINLRIKGAVITYTIAQAP